MPSSAAPSPLWRPHAPLLLASTSATRRTLLESVGLPVETEAPGIDERAIEARMADRGPGERARRLAAEKALAVSLRRPDRVVVGADQTLDCGGTVFHKPADRAAAATQLAALAGRRHVLHSALAVARGGTLACELAAEARLTMRPLSRAAIERYLDLAGEHVLNSVGAYQVERHGMLLFERVEGDHATILGLPLLPLLAALREMDLLAF